MHVRSIKFGFWMRLRTNFGGGISRDCFPGGCSERCGGHEERAPPNGVITVSLISFLLFG